MYNCKLCNYENEIEKNYINHCITQKHIKKEEDLKLCYVCDKKFISIKTYKQHKKNIHKKNIHNKNISESKINKSIKNKNSNANNQIFNSENLISIMDKNINIVKNEIMKSNINVIEKIDIVKEELKDEIKTEIKEEITEVKTVVNNAISRASCLIKILMDKYKTTPPIHTITHKECLKILRLSYKITYKRPNDFMLEDTLINNYISGTFTERISKAILELVNYKKPKIQPVYNTDLTRHNYVIKATDEQWNEDKAGIKFTEYIIKPVLNCINEIMDNFIEEKLAPYNVYNKTPEEIRDHYTKYHNVMKLMNDIKNNKFIKPILKEIGPYLRYLETEINELEKFNELEQIQTELNNIMN
jgi:hypothetical protein